MGKPHFRVLLCISTHWRARVCVAWCMTVWGQRKASSQGISGRRGRVIDVGRSARRAELTMTILKFSPLDFPQRPTRRPPHGAASPPIQVCDPSHSVSRTCAAAQPHTLPPVRYWSTQMYRFIPFCKSYCSLGLQASTTWSLWEQSSWFFIMRTCRYRWQISEAIVFFFFLDIGSKLQNPLRDRMGEKQK